MTGWWRAASPPATTPSFDSPSPLRLAQWGGGRGWGYAFAQVQKVG